MTTSVIRAGGTGVAGVQTTGGDDGALSLKVGPLDTTVEALNISSTGTGAFVGQVTATGFTGTLDGILGSGTPAAATVTTFTSNGIDDNADDNVITIGSNNRVDFAGGGNAFGIHLKYNAGTSGVYIGSPSAQAFQISSAGGSPYLNIDSGGKVGIGMTPVASYGLLQVGSAVTSVIGVTGLQAFISGANSALGQNGNLAIITTTALGTNIGGSIGLGGKYTGATSVLFAHIAGRKENATDNNSAGYLQLATQTQGGLPTEKARINSTGSVLVGTTANIAANAKIFALGNGVGIAVGYGTGNAEYRHMYINSPDGNLNFFSTSNNATLSAAGAWTDASDRRIKKNIVDIKYGLEDVLKIQPRSYQMKEVAGDYIGLIAQEIEEIIPEVVSGDPEKQLTLHYGSLVAVAFKAIQEQQATIEALKTRITALEG